MLGLQQNQEFFGANLAGFWFPRPERDQTKFWAVLFLPHLSILGFVSRQNRGKDIGFAAILGISVKCGGEFGKKLICLPQEERKNQRGGERQKQISVAGKSSESAVSWLPTPLQALWAGQFFDHLESFLGSGIEICASKFDGLFGSSSSMKLVLVASDLAHRQRTEGSGRDDMLLTTFCHLVLCAFAGANRHLLQLWRRLNTFE